MKEVLSVNMLDEDFEIRQNRVCNDCMYYNPTAGCTIKGKHVHHVEAETCKSYTTKKMYEQQRASYPGRRLKKRKR